MYYIIVDENDTNQLCLYCRQCGHRDTVQENILVIHTHKTSTNIKRTFYINKYTKLDPTLPRIYSLPCPNETCTTHAKENAAARDVLYIRYDEDGLKYVYLCCVCDTVWNT